MPCSRARRRGICGGWQRQRMATSACPEADARFCRAGWSQGIVTRLREKGSVPRRELCPDIVCRADQSRLRQCATKESQLAQTDGPNFTLYPSVAGSASIRPIRMGLEGAPTHLERRQASTEVAGGIGSSTPEFPLRISA